MKSDNEHKVAHRVIPRAGLDIVSIKPIFSPLHRAMLTVSGAVVKVFSTNTGQCIKILRGYEPKDHIVTIQSHLNNSFYTCSQGGYVMHWNQAFIPTKKVHLQANFPICHFTAPHNCAKWFVAGKPTEDKLQVSLWSCDIDEVGEPGPLKLVMEEASPRDQCVSVTSDGCRQATVIGNTLNIQHKDKQIRHLVSDNKILTCVIWHPTEENTLATADTDGMIIIWRDVHVRHPHRTRLHWHHSAVGDLTFSLEGTSMYSAGKESVLVCWNVFETTKKFLPRIGMPILRVVLSEHLNLVALCMEDNSIQLIQNWIPKLLLTELVSCTPQALLSPDQAPPQNTGGLQVDPSPDNFLVLNARYGHIQFYSTVDHHTVFMLDVVKDNYEPEIDNKIVIRKQVGKLALDATGNLLATTESWYDGLIFKLCLKLWRAEQKQFILYSQVERPHTDFVVALRFLPQGEKLVSVAANGEISLWQVREKKLTCIWKRGPPPIFLKRCCDADVAQDGSLVALAINTSVALWDLDNLCHLDYLSHPQTVKQVRFGKEWRRNMLVTSTGTQLSCWNLFSLETEWVVDLKVVYLESHLHVDLMVAVTDSEVLTFNLMDGKLHKVCNCESFAPIIGAAFVPKESRNKMSAHVPWYHHSKLYLIDYAQVLYEVTDEKDITFEEQAKKSLTDTIAPLSWLSAEMVIADHPSPSTGIQKLPKNILEENSSSTNMKENLRQKLTSNQPKSAKEEQKDEEMVSEDEDSKTESSDTEEEETKPAASPPKEPRGKRPAEDDLDSSTSESKLLKVEDEDQLSINIKISGFLQNISKLFI